MALINTLLTWLMKKRMHQIELFMKYPIEVQEEWFRRLIETASETEWGKKYHYRSITTREQFAERVPISAYEQLQPYIERMQLGEQNLLWPEEIRWFAKSSGTTASKSKFIPVSQSALEECHFKGGKDMLALFVNNFPETEIFEGRGLVMGGSHSITEVNNDSYYVGDLSAILIQNLPFWVQLLKTPHISIALMDEWESKIDLMARETLTHDVRSISGVPSWTLVLLRKVLELTGKNNISEVWPNLEVFFHGGVSFEPYRSKFSQLIPADGMHYMETYNASEGFFGIQDSRTGNDLLLMLDYGIYYEFIPVDQLDSDHPKTLDISQVEIDKNYALVISTNSGLWRYLIGDTIKFTSLHPFRIRITGRTRSFINTFGEELMVDNADRALAIACSKCHAQITDYTAAPRFSEDGKSAAHEWLIEFDTPPANLSFFAEAFDNALKSLNSDYEAKRYKNMILQPPLIQALDKGTFYNWMRMKGKLGGQHKVPRLSNHRDIVEEILLHTKGKGQANV
ncbi:MAG TPA: GH3 auxin-responsive promoter family protein [Bacteroidales bacterium]|nr:GH3 auxin-responsive promoter family protein [Bacteroidales bacterium]